MRPVIKKAGRLTILSAEILDPAFLTSRAHGLERPPRWRSCSRSGQATPRSASRLSAASSVEATLNADAEPASEPVGLAGRRRPEETEAGEACAAWQCWSAPLGWAVLPS